ncbi:UDP-N-acetylmuramoyl-L-alanine--D-glutamate ligase [Caproiciproducens sp. NJN-50]|uniref:UDP-N-acetylmuramoyl-L-alanine--D-glutamate ligase n=1 Tax=Acutalibacteraceae TaxID=3082771 RepID=UPI000FFE0A72|nr:MULTISPECIES: UDP-N-acetylmuramoyl-L-alanine--D-glutamate ligase [Acutalibacteraceae]QAT48537.1 UDP-N-acetylmuramoyl-L-alanine--D-glutamate ligase [Caproiciproducens sp. NJN-50]
MDIRKFYRMIKGRTVAFCGIGGSNLPLAVAFAKQGAVVTARDKRTEDKLGEAAEKLTEAGVRLRCGEDYLKDLDEEIVFRTPAMRYTLPELDAARARGAAVTSEMEIFFETCPCQIFAVTGSDGKTTTTTVISKILESAGKRAHLGGNIGDPLLPRVEQMAPEDAAVAELSSFQLISMRRSPDVAVVTNVTPNHLDVHKDMQEYIDAKRNIILHQDAFGRAVLNADNEITASFARDVRGQCLLFSRRHPVEHGAYMDPDGEIYFVNGMQKTRVMNASDIKIPGKHNIENYLAAICAVWGYAGVDDIARVAKNFAGVEHRNELVREFEGVRYFNDSIGTTPSRTISGALSLFDQRILLIAGGYDKNIPFEPLGPVVADKVKVLVLIGQTADKIERAVVSAPNYRPENLKIFRADTLEEAVNLCQREAESGDVVSLSPACASFGMFPNYETRGEIFRELVNALK